MAENIDARENWRTLALAFVVWAAHFMAVYGATLVLPGNPAVRWISIALTVPVLGGLLWWWRRLDNRSIFAGFALIFAGAAIIGQALPPVLMA